MSFVMLTGCATTGGKPKQAAEAEPQTSAAEQLADALNTKAEAKRQKGDVGYRDPLVHSVHGTRQQMVAEETSSQSFFPPAPAGATPMATDAPAGIAGLVTQPTGVNANRSSIYSTPAPIAVNPDGTLANTQAGAGQPQGPSPIMRSVYSMPPSATQNATPQQGNGGMPVDQTSQAVIPPPVIRNAAYTTGSPMKPTADATPSKILPARGSTARRIDSKEALMLAHIVASKGQGQDGKPLITQPQSGAGL
ncbi:hypothetical protein [Rhizobium leucaenae]|uniref:Uncharacterized protein n=1 Tax=Rhizobium leucaenae TaxID=29450 RepID=A0A7W6ZXS3_9HYPH|nr:hypothetical protein [Rhizobium leucaenae]MBB4570604.1 hypothetical protein [Rhizobium leucaenae]MBB6304630.1 hypothetical protein [Rhizobium leucaenae]